MIEITQKEHKNSRPKASTVHTLGLDKKHLNVTECEIWSCESSLSCRFTACQ